MGYRLSIWINLGFLLSLAVVTSLALSDHPLNPSDQMNAEPIKKLARTSNNLQNQMTPDAQEIQKKQICNFIISLIIVNEIVSGPNALNNNARVKNSEYIPQILAFIRSETKKY